MTINPSSPRRRHILSSINPEERCLPAKRSRERNDDTGTAGNAPSPTEQPTYDASEPTQAESSERKSTRFRFKSKHRSHRSSRHRDRDYEDGRRQHRDRDDDRDDDRDGDRDGDREDVKDENSEEKDDHRRHHRHRRSHHSSHHKRRRRHRSRTRSPTPPIPHGPPPLSPETAFRESLFDAMVDDEGAAYWEGVYGQPVHVYPNTRPGPEGELERMDDDEYAAYVRRKMWEKTHQGLLEERERREQERLERSAREREARRLTKEMEDSLRRGEERRRRRGWMARFEEYTAAWADWAGAVGTMSWPVMSGKREDINSENVRDFFVNGLDPAEIGEKDFLARLRDERVRWHPDKMQQRLGANFDDSVQQDVTAVFQIIDKLWSDTRSKG
jgi:hypothetical protein